jgi:hypothetical protein
MQLTTTKNNRKEIKEIAKQSNEMYKYLMHICNVLYEPKKFKLSDREVYGFKRDLIDTLKKLDENNSRIIGRLGYEEVIHEAHSTTFKLDYFSPINISFENKPHKK